MYLQMHKNYITSYNGQYIVTFKHIINVSEEMYGGVNYKEVEQLFLTKQFPLLTGNKFHSLW